MSSGGEVSVKMTAEEAGLFAALAKLTAENEKLRAGLLGTEAATAKADKELKRFADRMKANVAMPIDRLKEQFAQIDAAVKKGLLTEQQATAGKKAAQKEYQKELANTKEAHGGVGASAVASGVAIVQAWTGALSKLSQLTSAMREENNRALKVQEESGRTKGSLAQIATDQADMADLSSKVDELVKSGAAPTISSAVNTIFAARSAGGMEDLPNLSKLSSSGVIGDVPGFIESAAALRKSTGEESAGSISDVIAKGFTAAALTTRKAESLVIGAAKAGSQAKGMGIIAADLLSGVGIIATAKASDEEGGTRMAAFLSHVRGNEELQGKNLPEIVEAIDAMKLTTDELDKMLSREGLDAFDILLTNIKELKSTSEATRATDTGKEIAAKEGMALSVPSVRADLLARRAKSVADTERETEGRVVALQEAVIEQGVSERRAGARTGLAGKLGGSIGVPEGVTREVDAVAFGGFMRNIFALSPGNRMAESMAESDRTNPELREALRAAIADRDAQREQATRDLKAAADKFSQAVDRMGTQNRPQTIRQDFSGPARREAAVPAE